MANKFLRHAQLNLFACLSVCSSGLQYNGEMHVIFYIKRRKKKLNCLSGLIKVCAPPNTYGQYLLYNEPFPFYKYYGTINHQHMNQWHGRV